MVRRFSMRHLHLTLNLTLRWVLRYIKADVLCLIEAMKLMNEVTAEKDGEIVSICAENGQVVDTVRLYLW